MKIFRNFNVSLWYVLLLIFAECWSSVRYGLVKANDMSNEDNLSRRHVNGGSGSDIEDERKLLLRHQNSNSHRHQKTAPARATNDNPEQEEDNRHRSRKRRHRRRIKQLQRDDPTEDGRRMTSSGEEKSKSNENSRAGNRDDLDQRDEHIVDADTDQWDDISTKALDLESTHADVNDSTDDDEDDGGSDPLDFDLRQPSKFGQHTNIGWFDGVNAGNFIADALQLGPEDDSNSDDLSLTLDFSMSPRPSFTQQPAPSPSSSEVPTSTPLQSSAPSKVPSAGPTSNGNEGTSSPSMSIAPTPVLSGESNCENLPRQVAVADLLLPYTPIETLNNTRTSQGKAFSWIVNDDPGFVDPCSNPSQIVQRYTLATLYYATMGDTWTTSTSWLTREIECGWAGVDCLSSDPFNPQANFVVQLLLPSNNLDGSIPNEIVALSRLRTIDASSNIIQGNLPTTITKLSDLQKLNLEMNIISGELPPEFGELRALTDLNLAENMFTGSLPSSIGNLENLSSLRLDRNEFIGFIPEELWTRSTRLEKLVISNNALTGTLSDSIGNMQLLRELILTSNRIGGTLPILLGRLSNLVQLHLGGNTLEGTIRDTFTRFTNLRSIDLSMNQFTGSIPTQLFDLPSLVEISLNGNSLDGRLPDNIGNAEELRSLLLQGNTLSGTVPDIVAGQLTNLSVLQLQDNQLVGSMAVSMCSLREEGAGVLSTLWTDCGDGASPRLECDVPECCTRCFPDGFTGNKAEGIVSNR